MTLAGRRFEDLLSKDNGGTVADTPTAVAVMKESACVHIGDAQATDRQAIHAEADFTRRRLTAVSEDLRAHVTSELDRVMSSLSAVNHTDVGEPGMRRVRYRVPHASQYFSGRDGELALLEHALSDTDRVALTQGLVGLGGVGKSQLAAQYLQCHLAQYDVVAWVGAEDGGVADLTELATALGLPARDRTPAECADLAVNWLATCRERWLLVLDDVASPEQLRTCCPATGNGQVLITSRHRGVGEFAPLLTVEVFDEERGEDYLVRRSGKAHEREPARRLSQALGGLPLALAHAGAYCSSGTSFDAYLSMLGELPSQEMFETHPEASYRKTVACTWQASIAAASARAPLAVDVLGMAAYLAPDKIPTALIWVLVGSPTDARAAKQLSEAVSALSDLSLIDVERDGSYVAVHRLLQKVIRDDPGIHSTRTGAQDALEALSAAFPTSPYHPDSWVRCEQLLPHIEALVTAKSPKIDSTQMVELLNLGGLYLDSVTAHDRAIELFETALALARAAPGTSKSAILLVRQHLAGAYHHAGDFSRAIALAEGTVEEVAPAFGQDHRNVLAARSNLAAYYASAGRSAEAVALSEVVLRDAERLMPGDAAAKAAMRINIASLYRDMGRGDQAIALLEQTVADLKSTSGHDDPVTMSARHSLASVYSATAQTDEAVALCEEILADRERVLGVDHGDTIISRNNLAVAYSGAQRYAEAIQLQKQVLTDRERILGVDHPLTLAARTNLAGSYHTTGRTSEAIDIELQVIDDCERILGPEHPQTLSARSDLGATYRLAGELARSAEILEQVLVEQEQNLPFANISAIGSAITLAETYVAMERADDATALLQRYLTYSERVLGTDHTYTGLLQSLLKAVRTGAWPRSDFRAD